MNYKEFVQLDGRETDIDIRCTSHKGVVISDILNIEGNFVTGQAAPESKFSTISYCKEKTMPSLVSSDVQFLITINYSVGDVFKIAYRSVRKECFRHDQLN